ncbi:hypothetical protein OIU79_016346, partial [Salix purpurea]
MICLCSAFYLHRLVVLLLFFSFPLGSAVKCFIAFIFVQVILEIPRLSVIVFDVASM